MKLLGASIVKSNSDFGLRNGKSHREADEDDKPVNCVLICNGGVVEMGMKVVEG